MKKIFMLMMVLSLTLSACGRDKDFSTHSSNNGNILENFIPGDIGMMFTFSLRNDEQFTAVENIEEALGDEGRFSRTISAGLDTQFSEAGLDYDKDLAPAFGDQFRLLYAARPATEKPDVFSVATLEDAEQMKTVFETLEGSGDLELKKLSTVDAYVDEASNFYAAIYEDLLLVANTPDNLVEMLGLDSSESLWESKVYKDGLEDIGPDYMFYGLLFPKLFSDELKLGSTGLGISNIPAVVDRQALVVRAEDDGFSFEAFVEADKDEAKKNGVSFDAVPKSEPYLFKEVSSDGLMAYFESYGMAQTFTEAQALGDDAGSLKGVEELFKAYLGLDFETEVLTFLDKGIAFSIHQNDDGVVPGISILADVSSDVEAAENFLSTIDTQVTSLLFLLESALPGAVTKDVVTIDGEEFNILEIDLSALERTDAGNGALPAVVTSSVIQLAYGVIGDRLLITTADVWQTDDPEMISQSVLYEALKKKLDGVDEGLILIDAQGVSDFMGTLRALREQLTLGVSDTSSDFENLLKGFSGGIASSKTGSYETKFGGFLMIGQ